MNKYSLVALRAHNCEDDGDELIVILHTAWNAGLYICVQEMLKIVNVKIKYRKYITGKLTTISRIMQTKTE